MIRVFLIEPRALARAALQKLLDSASELQVSGVAAEIEGSAQRGGIDTADVILFGVDGALPAMGLARRVRRGVALTCLLRCRAAALARPLLECGVRGLVSDGSPPDEVFACLQNVHAGRIHLSPDIARRLALPRARPFDSLSAREWQVMLMLARGDSPQGISRALCLSPKTVSTYRCRLLHKLGARSDLDVLRLALRDGVLPAEAGS